MCDGEQVVTSRRFDGLAGRSDFPDLERDDIRAALAFAADRERRLIADPAA